MGEDKSTFGRMRIAVGRFTLGAMQLPNSRRGGGTRRLVGVVAVVCLLIGTETVMAVGDGPDPDPDPTTTRTLTVTPPPDGGTVTGTMPLETGGTDEVIACPGDCSEEVPTGTTITLSASRAGWEPDWEGCTSEDDQQRCAVKLTLDKTVSLTWLDVTDPTVSFPSNAPKRANQDTVFTVNAEDHQSGMDSVYFYPAYETPHADYQAPYQYDLRGTFTQGGTVTLEAEARDEHGNFATATHTFIYDASAALPITSDPSLTRCPDPPDGCPQPPVAKPPKFTFERPSDMVHVGCATVDVGTQIPEVQHSGDCNAASTYTPEIPANGEGAENIYDGAYRTFIVAYDGLNREEYVYDWTLDRRGPSINLYQPMEGSFVTTPFTLNVYGSDKTPPYEYRCDFGSGFGTCGGTHDPPEGPTTLRIESEDALGNKRTLERKFIYDKTKPAVQITEGPAEGAFTDSGSVRFGFRATDAVGPLTTTCKLDQGEFGACDGPNSHSLENLNPGIHRFTLRVVDAAGHETVVDRQFVVPQATTANTTIINNNTTNTTNTTNPGGGAVGGEAETPAPALGRTSRKFSVRRGKTTIKRLVLSGLARGAKIEVTCKGRGCFRKAKKYTAKKSKLNLTKLFRKRKLSAKARIDIAISQDGRTTRVFRITTQKGKKKPKLRKLCLPAGASKPGKCA